MRTVKRVLLKNILLVVAIVGFGLVVWGARAQLAETWHLLSQVNPWSILLLPLTQLISYFFLSQYYRTFIKSFGGVIGAWRAFGTTTALNFVNQILPSGGASGITYIINAFRDAVSGGQVTLIQLGRYVLAFLSYVPLLLLAMLWLVASGEFSGQIRLVFTVLMLISLPGTVLLILAVSKQRFVDVAVGGILRFLNRIIAIVTRGRGKPITVSATSGFMKEFHDGVTFLKSQGHQVIKPYLFMQLSTLAEVTIVNLAFWVLGVSINPGIVLLAFTAANVVGVISIVPGDVGVHELAIITVLSYIGIDQSTAIAGTLLYRVFNKMIVLSIGFYFYIRLIKPLMDNRKEPTASG